MFYVKLCHQQKAYSLLRIAHWIWCFISENKVGNRCPIAYPYSFHQNNRCCSSNKESTFSAAGFSYSGHRPFCQARIIGDASICCDGDSMDCPKKPCFDYGPSKGNNNVLKNMSHLYQNKPRALKRWQQSCTSWLNISVRISQPNSNSL